jgi:hypothetical protein
MKNLKILTLGTKRYLKKYSLALKQDCERLGYAFDQIAIDEQKDISAINHKILEEMVYYIVNHEFDRLCFMDPECRILRSVPNEWIMSSRPVVFFKIRNEDGSPDPKFVYKNKHGNGERLPCRIIGQPMFISKQDVGWFKMTLDLSRAASDLKNKQYTRNEMFIETSLEYNKINFHKEHIIYHRHARLPHKVVKGTWETPDTVIQHPDIYGLFDNRIVAGNPVFGDDPILDQKLLERHTSKIEIFDRINHHMWLESSDKWEDFGEWSVHAKSGRMKLKGFNGIRYHHNVRIKLEKKLNTPLIKLFKKNTLNK